MDKRIMASRLLWFVGLWAGGVLAISIVGLIIKFWLNKRVSALHMGAKPAKGHRDCFEEDRKHACGNTQRFQRRSRSA